MFVTTFLNVDLMYQVSNKLLSYGKRYFAENLFWYIEFCFNTCTVYDYTGTDVGGWTPLIWACYKGHSKVVETLIRHGADVNSRGLHHVSG